MRQQFANQLALVIAAIILVLSVMFAVIQSGGQPAAGQGSEPQPLVAPASKIPHPIVGYTDCQECHALTAESPFPQDHAGWPDEYCAACHAPSALE